MKKNLILGFSTGYQFPIIESFIASALDSADNTQICLFTNGMDERFYHVAAKHGIRVEDASPYLKLGYHPQNARYFAYRKFLQTSGTEYANVLLTDVRDVFFQGDPFSFRYPRPVCFFLEDTKIAWETWNGTWVRDLYGPEVLAAIADNYVSCCGTVLGTIEGIGVYLDKLCAELESRSYDRLKVYDQGAHNYIVWRMKPNWGWVDTTDMIVNTVGCTSADRIEIVDDLAVIDGKVSPVVHQWDRHEALKKHISNSARFKI